MTPSIRVRCPGCGARIKAPAQLMDQTRACPGCGQPLSLRPSAPRDAGPVVLTGDPAAPPQPETCATGAEKLVLLVDDDRELNDGLRCLLEKRGHRVLQAFDGVQAKEMVCRQPPNLMVLDMMMPRLGGYPVLEYLRESPQAPPVIMITAKEGGQHQVYAEYLGVVDYLRKPFAIERFLASVEKALGTEQGV